MDTQAPCHIAPVDMHQVVGTHNIVMICLDTLRWDAARDEEAAGTTAVLNRHAPWTECFAPGDFTWPAHHAIFAGFLPAPVSARTIDERRLLFFPKQGGNSLPPKGAFVYTGTTFVEGLARVGYQTNCIGGVSFFDQRSPLGSVFPAMFQHSFWRPAFACPNKKSIEYQVALVCKRLQASPLEQPLFYYINISAIHYPNWYYLEDRKTRQDDLASHKAALRYVDSHLETLFAAFAAKRQTFVIVLSDHGTCYGEDGFWRHGLPHPTVNRVPYKHFFL